MSTNYCQAAELARRHDANREPVSWRALVRQLAANIATSPTWTEDDLRRISTPTLMIAGENDVAGNLDQIVAMKRNIPGAEILIVNNAEHVPQFTHPQIVGPVVMDFIARHPGPP